MSGCAAACCLGLAEAALAGANALALLDEAGEVEIVTASQVELIGTQRFRLSGLVRGIGGSEVAAMRSLPPGSRIVVLDGAAVTLTSGSSRSRPSRAIASARCSDDVGDPDDGRDHWRRQRRRR
jgi:hypothetical protein